MRRQLRWYGASPLHLLALLACFGLAGYAAARLVPSRPLGVAAWFLGAVIGHDLLLMPLYSLADRSAMAAIRHRDPRLPVTPWINYVRVPAALSGLLLLVWFPLILRLRSPYHASTTLSADPYVWHWLAVTGALFLLSAVAFAVRLRGKPPAASPPERPATAPAGAVTEAETDPGHPGDVDSGRGQPPAVPEEPEPEDRKLEERKPEEPEPEEPEPEEPEPEDRELEEPEPEDRELEDRELEEREPGQCAGELPPAEADSRQDPPSGYSPGRPQPAAEDPDPPDPVHPRRADPQHHVRPADPTPDTQ